MSECVCVCTICVPNAKVSQKRLLDPLKLDTDSSELAHGFWEANWAL